MTQRVFVDADVLVSRTLRDWVCLLRQKTVSTFQLHSTEDVLAEALSKVRDRNPRFEGGVIAQMADGIRGVLDEMVRDFPSDTPYPGTDEGDYHVHAAAVASGADILLTCDTGLLEMDGADDFAYEAYHPDDFFVLVDDSDEEAVKAVIREQLPYWTKRRNDGDAGLVEALIAAGCPNFAARVDSHLKTLSGVAPN